MTRIARNHKGYRIGEGHHCAKLSDDQVREIRAKYKTGKYSYLSLCAIYRCGESTVRDIVKGITRWDILND